MLNENFGKGLSKTEKNFIDKYCELLKEYGDISDFPITDESKFNYYTILKSIIDKLSLEEIMEFNNLANKYSMSKFYSDNTVHKK